MLTPKGQAYVLFSHAPHVQKVGVKKYQEYWQGAWEAVKKYADPQETAVIMDANQPARPEDRPKKRREDGLRGV